MQADTALAPFFDRFDLALKEFQGVPLQRLCGTALPAWLVRLAARRGCIS